MIDFTTLPADAESLEAALHQLVEEKVFTEEEGKILLSQKRNPSPLSSLLAFARGPLAEKMKTASHIRKEMPFSILLPAHSFYPKCEEGENIFLQGVMDCLLEYEKDFIIIDYKTDRTMTEEELKEHYKIQLQVYGEAAEKLLGKTGIPPLPLVLHLREGPGSGEDVMGPLADPGSPVHQSPVH